MQKHIRTFYADRSFVNQRRDHIVRSSARLFAKKGYNNTTMREVVEACNMSKGTVYHYVGSKLDILYLAIARFLSDEVEISALLNDRLQGLRPTEALRQSIKSYLQPVEYDHEVFTLIVRELINLEPSDQQTVLGSANRVATFFETLLIRCVEQGVFKVSNPRFVAGIIIMAGYAWAHCRGYFTGQFTFEEYIRELTEFILEAIGADTSPASAMPDDVEEGTSTGVTDSL